MKKIFFILAFIFLFINTSYAASGKGDATQYEITMKKVELCEDSACNTTHTVATKNMALDIASASAATDVGTYAPTTGLPMGVTFTHVRVTISRTFTITGSVVLTGDDCYTDGGSDADTDQMLVGKTSASAVSSTMVLVDDSKYNASNGTKNAAGGQITIGYTSPTYASSMSVSGTDAKLIYELTSPYKVGMTSPKITVKFDTQNAIGAENTACAMWIEEPLCTVTIN
tara:strand:+ start:169 stop:852 length:684 start_codon:yes stop_codon:yes gene_type:complete